MRFQFRLQSFLNHARLKEDRKKMELAAVMRRLVEIQNSIATKGKNIRKLLAQGQGEQAAWKGAPYAVEKIELDAQEIEALRNKMTDAEELKAQIRQELLELSAKREALETLEEKSKKEHRKLLSKKEQKDLEEIHRYFRKGERA